MALYSPRPSAIHASAQHHSLATMPAVSTSHYVLPATEQQQQQQQHQQSMWKHQGKQPSALLHPPMTPPMSSDISRRRPQTHAGTVHLHAPSTTTLPPLSHLLPDSSNDVGPSCSRLPAFQTTFPEPAVTSYMVVDDPQSELEPNSEQESQHVAPSDADADADADAECDVPPMSGHAPNLPDWFDISRHRSAHFLAEKTCEMICYLWFAGARSLAPPSSASNAAAASSYPSPPGASPYPHTGSKAVTAMQLSASPIFVQFMQKVLETTQVSQSVIVLSLHYIYRLKERNSLSSGQPGSEFRIAIAALMMANKFLDDNTYTNKTWSEVSGIDLAEINKMEKEFLSGVNYTLYVDKSTYGSWLHLLKGLVMAKERDSKHYRHRHPRRSSHHRAHRRPRPSGAHGDVSVPVGRCAPQQPQPQYQLHYDAAAYMRSRPGAERARSTSPNSRYPAYQFSFSSSSSVAAAPPPPVTTYHSPVQAPTRSPSPQHLSSKRSANAAFSPTTAHFPDRRPIKQQRPTGISLQIPDSSFAAVRGAAAAAATASGSTHSPLESSLQSFAHMSLGGSSPRHPHPHTEGERPAWPGAVAAPAVASNYSTPSTIGENAEAMSSVSASSYSPNDSEDALPHTLVAAYRANERLPSVAPQNLYYYSLACSPPSVDGEAQQRKAKLRSYRPPQHQQPQQQQQYQYQQPQPQQYAQQQEQPSHSVLPSSTSTSTSASSSYFPPHQHQHQHHHPHRHASYTLPPARSYPMHVQSASTSPQGMYASTAPSYAGAGLTGPGVEGGVASTTFSVPQPHTTVHGTMVRDAATAVASPGWVRQHQQGHHYTYPTPPATYTHARSAYPTPRHEPVYPQQQQHYQQGATISPRGDGSAVPCAPFANAGPPGVHFSYATPPSSSLHAPVLPSTMALSYATADWSAVRGRRL